MIYYVRRGTQLKVCSVEDIYHNLLFKVIPHPGRFVSEKNYAGSATQSGISWDSLRLLSDCILSAFQASVVNGFVMAPL